MYQQPIKSVQTGAAGCGQASSKSEKCRASLGYAPMSLLTDHDLYLFNEGSHLKLYERLGSHPRVVNGREGTNFAVWAPDADKVFVMGSFNGWNKTAQELHPRGQSGIWEGFVPDVGHSDAYKYHVVSRYHGYEVDKADPVAVHAETPSRTASIVWNLDYEWRDQDWMSSRAQRNSFHAAISIYEVHLGSWRRIPEENNRWLSYREIAPKLAEYVAQMGFTHVEFLPLTEHPFYGSWGYQTTGYFAPTSRYGTPQDLMYLVDYLHQHGIAVILDWVPSHFPTDDFALGYFDGTHLYEHSDPRKGIHKDWDSYIFNYGRHEVRSFLLSSATFWFDRYHIDGLRVDAVASMLYLDYSRKEGEWIPNIYGGNENLEAIDFLRRFNAGVYQDYPGIQNIPQELTFRMLYAFHENFILPLSHDEVVHGKGSLLSRMPGDLWQKFANMRLLYSYMYAQPAKKLLFMGGEFGQWAEWSHDNSLEWHLLQYEPHRGLQKLIADLNATYRAERALHELDCDPAGFEWIDGSDSQQSMLSFMRRSKGGDELIAAVFNFTPMPRHNYRVGVPRRGYWREIFNSDSQQYGGADFGNLGGNDAQNIAWQGKQYSLNLIVPPLGAVFFKSSNE